MAAASPQELKMKQEIKAAMDVGVGKAAANIAKAAGLVATLQAKLVFHQSAKRTAEEHYQATVLGLMAALTHKAVNPTLVTKTSAPPELLCPIGYNLMEDPVLLVETQETYDRKNIECWFRTGHRTLSFRMLRKMRALALMAKAGNLP
ncbi:hypothetical protein WJX72_006097 [[Myrmecia] bisecta]|uniref:U-box domain-containing protein n=1 Tax=[Myrmecia] bisecta TaxID=41462 RepID=A0AAW1PAV0_9CHLO